MLHIAFLVGAFTPGGAQRQILLLARELLARGHEVTVFVLFRGGSQEVELQAMEGLRFVALSPRPRTRFLSRMFGLFAAPRRLRRWMDTLGLDALYSMLHVPNAVAWLALRGRSAPLLIWGIRASQLELDWKQRPAVRFCARVSGSVPLLISNSRAGLAYLEAAGFQPRRTALVENAVDLERFRRRPAAGASLRAALGLPEQVRVVGTVARLDPVKGYEDLLEAFARVCAQRGDAVLLCVGDGPPAYARALREQAQALGLKERVVWTGHRDDVEAVFAALDLFVLASRSEGFPNVLVEALACEVPCVSTDVGDARRILGNCAGLVPAGNVDALSQAMLRSLAVPPAETADVRARLVQELSPARLAQDTLALIQGSLTAGRGHD